MYPRLLLYLLLDTLIHSNVHWSLLFQNQKYLWILLILPFLKNIVFSPLLIILITLDELPMDLVIWILIYALLPWKRRRLRRQTERTLVHLSIVLFNLQIVWRLHCCPRSPTSPCWRWRWKISLRSKQIWNNNIWKCMMTPIQQFDLLSLILRIHWISFRAGNIFVTFLNWLFNFIVLNPLLIVVCVDWWLWFYFDSQNNVYRWSDWSTYLFIRSSVCWSLLYCLSSVGDLPLV